MNIVLAGAGSQTPLLPLMILLGDAIGALLLAGVSEGEEHALLEGKLGDQGAQGLISRGQLLALDGGQPFHVGVPLLAPVVPREHGAEGLVLGLAELDKVPPPAQLISQIEVLGAADEFADLDDSVRLGLGYLLFPQVDGSPGIVEADLAALGHIEIDEIQLFVILMREIHGVSIPEAEEETLGLLVMVGENTHETVDNGFYSLELD